MKLTDRQRAIVRFVAEHTARTGCSPTCREIGLATGLRSTDTVAWYIRRLRDFGLLDAERALPRTVRLADAVTRWPDGAVMRTVLVASCSRCLIAHPDDFDCRAPRRAAPGLSTSGSR